MEGILFLDQHVPKDKLEKLWWVSHCQQTNSHTAAHSLCLLSRTEG